MRTFHVEVGRKLTGLLVKLAERILNVQQQVEHEFGFVVTGISCQEDPQLEPSSFVIKAHGVEVARAEVVLDKILAVGDPSGLGKLKGIPTVDPLTACQAFGSIHFKFLKQNSRDALSLTQYQ